MGKEETIRQVEEEILKTDTYLFRQLKEKLSKEGVTKDHELMKMIDVLVNETWSSSKEKKIIISNKYEKKLKLLTILSLFFGAPFYSLARLEKEIALKREEALNLLVEANIAKLITVQIDQQQGNIKILKSKIREKDASKEREKYINGKLIHIKDNNSHLEDEISNILKQVNGSEKEKEVRAPRMMMDMHF